MNVSQIGQKKKKQAVRRLSQGSAGQGIRKDDIRRKLEARRRLAASGSDGSERKFPRGNVRQGRTEESSETRPFGIKRSIGHSQKTSKRHVSPLVNTGVSQGSTTNTQATSNIFSNPTATAPNENKNENTQGNVFSSSTFKSSPTKGNALGKFQSNNRIWINEALKRPEQETQRVFGSKSSPNKSQGNVFASKQFDPKTGTSHTTKIHPSPLAGLITNSPSKAGASIMSGLSNQANTESSNVSSLVEQYEQNTTQTSSQTLSGNIFQSAVSSTSLSAGLQSTNQGVFSAKDTHAGSVFGGSLISSTTPPPNVNLFATNQKENTDTVVSNSAVQKSTGNTTLFSGYVANAENNVLNMENKYGVFGNAMKSATTGGDVFNLKQNTNPIGSTDLNPIGSTTLNPLGSTNLNPLGSTNLIGSTNLNPLGSTNLIGSTNLNPLGSTNLSPLGSTNLIGSTNLNPVGSTNPALGYQSSLLNNKGSAFGNTSLPVNSSQQENTSNTFGSLSSATSNTTAQDSSQNKPSVFGGAGFPTSTTQPSTLFTASQNSNSPMLSSKPFSNAGSVFGGADLPQSSTNLTNKPGPFSNSTSASQNFGADSNAGSVFGNARLPVASASLSSSAGPFTLNSSGASSQTPTGNIFGSTGVPETTASLSNTGGPFTSSDYGATGPTTKASGILGNTGVQSDASGKGGVFTSSKTSTDPRIASNSPFSIDGQTSARPASIFGSAIFAATQDQRQGPFTVGNKTTSPGFSQPPKPGSIFGNAGSLTISTGIFAASQDPKQGPFTSKTSNPGPSQQPNSGSIFGNAGQSSTFSSGGVFSKQNNATFGSVFGSQTQDSQSGRISTNEKHKGLKRSLSNTDVSELTSILIKDLPQEYFDKKLLEREFAIFGANKVSLQPTKQSIVVNFATHECAKKAKSRALKLFPMNDAHVFWCRKKGTGRTSKTPEKPGGNKREFRSRRMSISNALNSIDASEFSSAMSAQERYTVLNEVDKQIRQAITPYRDIANAPVLIGVCCDMCSEKERYMREYQVNLSVFEMVPGTQDNRDGDVPRVEHFKAVKEYSRSAADKLEPLAHELRPVHVLQMTLDYLMANVMNNIEEKWEEWFNFLWNRTRAIRKDITQQHLCDVHSADLVEKITRFHIFCAHYLCEEGMHSFDPKINNENLTKCLQTLKQFYVDLYTDQEVKCPNEAEFQAYDILLNLNEGDTLRKAMQYRLEVRNSSEVKFALEVFSSLNSHNFVRFFKLVKSASYLNACIMHRYFTQVRRSALRVMTKAYSPKEPYPLQVLQYLLAFEDKDETSRFCSHYNFTTTDDSVQFSKVFTDPEAAFPLQRATNVIESKRKCSIGEVVNGSPLTNRPLHEPVSSFDANGQYIGLPNLVHMLQNTPDTPEPESPYEIHEPAINLPPEQRSPVVQQPTDDPRLILNKAMESASLDLIEEAVDGLVKDVCGDAIRQVQMMVDLEHQLSKTFADKFINDSLTIMVKEIAKECIEKEVEIKRRKIAIAESRSRMSLVVMNEIIRVFMKTELVTVARDTKRAIGQQMKAQSFAKMSAVIMREMLEDVMYEQCQEIALITRKEVVRQKKALLWKKAEVLRRNQMRKYFQSWSKEYHTRVHIRNILRKLPAKSPMLTIKQQLDKLLSSNDSTANVLTSPISYKSILKEREELQKRLTDMANEKEMKRLRAMQPINLTRLHTELIASRLMYTKRSYSNNCMKLVVSFPSRVEHFSLGNIQSLIKFKLRTESTDHCPPVPAELRAKLEQLSETQQISTQTHDFKYDIKACYGVLSTNELRKVQQHHLLLGLTGIFFTLHSNGQARDKMFWSNCRTRLRQLLRSKPPVPGIPLLIMNINTGRSDEQSNIEEQLGIAQLREDGLLSDCAVYLQQEQTDSDEFHKQLVHALVWLMSHSPETPTIEKKSLKGFVEKEILKNFTIPLYEETALRKEALLQPQCPEVIVDLYNSVIDYVIAMVTNLKLKDISLPIPEFIATDSPPVSWNSTATFERLYSILGKLKLPMPFSPATDGTWHSEYILCLDYINILLEEEPLKKFGFALVNRVERILSSYAKDYSDLSTTTLTAADVPWPELIEACIKTLLSWLHTLSGEEHVYYLPQDLEEFKQPSLWTEAATETVKLTKGNSEMRKKKSWTSKLCDLSAETEQELTRIETSRSILDVSERESLVEDDMEETARCFERNLGREKRKWKRFEDELRSILDEDDSVDLNASVNRQGVKRKIPSWSSGYKPEKANVKKSSTPGLEDLPDLNSTFSYFETSIVSLRDGLEMHRHLEKLTERKLKEALDENFE